MKFTAAAITLLLGLTSAHAQSVSAGRLGVTPTAEPEPVYVLDKHNVWNTIGSMTGGNFTPVAGGGGGGGGDTNIAQWGGVVVGPMTAYGTAPSGLFPGVNAYITNVPHVIIDSGGGVLTWPGTASPTNYGTAPAGTVPAVNAFVTNPSTLTWPGSATPSNYGTAPTGSVPAVNAFVTNPSTFSWPGGAPVTNYGTPPTGLVPAVNAFVTFPNPQPISAAALPLPTNAATATLQNNVQSAAGTPATSSLTVQGCLTCLAQPVSPASGTNWNVTQGTSPWVTSSTLTWPGTAGVAAYGATPSGTVPAVNAFVTNSGGSTTPFQPSATLSRMTPLTVGLTDTTATLPNGASTVVSNTDLADPIFCNVLGVAATVGDQKIPPSSWFQFSIPSGITTLHCIATGGSAIANGLGGSGLASGAGGGGGGGGGTASNVTIVNPSTSPVPTYATNATGPTQVTPSSTFFVTQTGQVFGTKTVPISIASSNASTSVVIQGGTAGLITYVTLISVEALAGKNFSLKEGTGTACATSAIVLTGNMPTSGSWDGANGGASPAIQTQVTGDDLCAVVTASTAYGGWMQLVQR